MKHFFDSLYYQFYKFGQLIRNSDAPDSAMYCVIVPSLLNIISILGFIRLYDADIVSDRVVEIIIFVYGFLSYIIANVYYTWSDRYKIIIANEQLNKSRYGKMIAIIWFTSGFVLLGALVFINYKIKTAH
jgi:hypothetical protein